LFIEGDDVTHFDSPLWSRYLRSDVDRNNVRNPASLQELLTLILLMWKIGWAHNNARK